jgi:hypothetical protein
MCRRTVGIFYIPVTVVAVTCLRRRKSGRRKPEAIASATEGSAARRNPEDWAFYFCAMQKVGAPRCAIFLLPGRCSGSGARVEVRAPPHAAAAIVSITARVNARGRRMR